MLYGHTTSCTYIIAPKTSNEKAYVVNSRLFDVNGRFFEVNGRVFVVDQPIYIEQSSIASPLPPQQTHSHRRIWRSHRYIFLLHF